MKTQAWPLVVIASLLLGAQVPSAHAGSLSAPTHKRVVVHGFRAVGEPPTIDAETAALLDEAAQIATGSQAVIVLLPDDAAAVDDAARMHQAEAARTYLVDLGIDLDRIQIDVLGARPLSIRAGAAANTSGPLCLSERGAN